ncbi:hypothetical protein CGCSCA1_v006120 [Colletotrichum siamense]|uniref:uncharacterized protein n=1 Tax=Colletotrichum siamense TaxID=690259 RepID=UPI0018733B29|nr:uncharacterized protein CGCS363_v000905 [Colletotrichum siamense]KAF4874772.1 hypothetical protein CGCSCA1_v006120 [Colletotrichum siamense]KAF5516311.1 hypothetical protein CGCS363_v000905 [Colletotrichum siamense]
MGGVILSPSAMPASTGLSEAPAPTPAGDINFGRLFQRDEDTAQILITQTVTRSWTTYVTVETLHGGLPAEPTARSSSGLSGKQLGIILGSVLGGVLVLSLIGCYFLCRRWKYWHKGRIPRSHTTSPYARTKPKFRFGLTSSRLNLASVFTPGTRQNPRSRSTSPSSLSSAPPVPPPAKPPPAYSGGFKGWFGGGAKPDEKRGGGSSVTSSSVS